MANTAFDHASALTIPGSTTNNGLVRWGDTTGTSFGNITGITSDGSNLSLLTRGEVRFSDADSSHYVAFEAPATVSTTYTMTLPADLPAANEYLKVTSYSGGAGVLEWASVSADTNTTYLTSWVDSSANAILRLTPSSGSADDLTIVAGTNITLTPSGDNLTIDAGGGRCVAGDTDNGLITWVTSDNTFAAEACLTWTGTQLSVFVASRGGAIKAFIKNTSCGANSSAELQITAVGAASGTADPQVLFGICGVGDSYIGIDNSASDALVLGTNSSAGPGANDSIVIKWNTGEVTMPKQPAAYVYNANTRTDVTGDNTVYTLEFNGELFDQGGDLASNVFTAPVTGRYYARVRVAAGNVDTNQGSGNLKIVSTLNTFGVWSIAPNDIIDSNESTLHYEDAFFPMTAGNTVYCTFAVNSGAKDVNVNGGIGTTDFGIWLVA